jgi:preprotein translocase subunit SecG
MNFLFTFIIVVQVLSAIGIIALVLLQHGKGADMGAAFGSGASGSLFGASGSSNFLSKSTAVAAAIFFAATLALAFIGNKHSGGTGGVMDRLSNTAPAATAPAAQSPSAPTTESTPKEGAAAPATSTDQANQIPK